MKINDVNRVNAVNPYRKAQHAGAAASGNRANRKDEISISPEALRLQEESVDPARTERVEQLRQSVQSGTYSVSSNKVAEKLLPYLTGNGE